jgi:putative ABC transport system permease protein
VIQDVRYAFRQLLSSPGFAVVAILTIGLGIGANTAIFSIVDSILLKPLPYEDSDRLVKIVENVPAEESFSGAPERTTNMSPSMFTEWRDRSTTLAAMSMERSLSMTLAATEPVRLTGLEASPALFAMLGAQPIVGRALQPSDETPGGDNVVVLSYSAWQRFFGGDSQVLGKAITLDAALYSIVGVMPATFTYPNAQTDFWKPLAVPVPPQFLGLPVMARLRDGVSLAAAQDEANNLGRELRGESATDAQPSGPPRIQLVSVKEELVAPIRSPLLVFVVAVGFVLLVACVNVANLFLARATTRAREIAIRMAIGASRARVQRQLLTESMLVAVLSGALGIALAYAGTGLFVALGQGLARSALRRFDAVGNAIPRLNEVALDVDVLLFTSAVTIATGLLFGVIPALQIGGTATRTADLRGGVAARPALRSLRRWLVVGQNALTVILLLGAGLLIKSFMNLTSTELGYDPRNVLTFNIPQPALEFPDDTDKQPQRTRFEQEVATRIGGLRGVEAAGFTNALPMVQMRLTLPITPQDSPTAAFEADMYTVSPGYFRAMGIRTVEGRGFDAEDGTAPRPVYVVNRAFAAAYFQGEAALGKTLALGRFVPVGDVVGVVDDVRHLGLDREPQPIVFVDPEHTPGIVGVAEGGVYFTVRTRGARTALIPQIRAIVRDLDANLAIDNVATMDQVVANSITTPRSYALLLGTFAASAFVLAMIGLYGVQTYFVTQRRQEIGIRLALGARRERVLRLFLWEGLTLSVAGLAAGLAGSALLSQYLERMLFGVAALDIATYGGVSIAFLAVMLAASYIPARQAATIDPQQTMRYE